MIVNEFNSSEKILRYMNKLDYFYNSSKTLIVTELDLTNHCNNLCPECSSSMINKDNAELSWLQIKDIINDLKKLDNKGIILSGGGEPLIHPDFIDTLYLIKRTGMKIGLNSNGLALNEEKAVAIAECCEYFRISLDASSKELYKRTHGMGDSAFDKVISNMRNMVKILVDTKSKLSFGAGFLTSKKTIGEMEDFVVLCKDIGLHFAQFRPFLNDMVDVSNEYNRLKDKYEDDKFKVKASLQKYGNFQSGTERCYDKCRGMFFSTVVTADAKVFACLHHRQNDKYKIGEIGERTLFDIWNSSDKLKVYENIDLNDCPHFCRNDSFNKTLQSLSKDVIHSEFL